MAPQGSSLLSNFMAPQTLLFNILFLLFLYREHSVNYRITPGDEVEDMYALLHEVKRQIPSINAVSSGAIASDYQRMRVESVCSRLGLVSLAYLWKQDQITLFEEMVSLLLSLFFLFPPLLLSTFPVSHHKH